MSVLLHARALKFQTIWTKDYFIVRLCFSLRRCVGGVCAKLFLDARWRLIDDVFLLFSLLPTHIKVLNIWIYGYFHCLTVCFMWSSVFGQFFVKLMFFYCLSCSALVHEVPNQSELKLFTIWTEDYFHRSFVSHRSKDLLAVFVQSYFPWCAVPVNWLCFSIVWSWSLKLIWTHWSLFLLLVVHR